MNPIPNIILMQVDLTPVIALIKAKGETVESAAPEGDLVTFFRTTYGNAGKHFRSGTPGKWRTDSAFDAAVANVFVHRFQCLLDAFKCAPLPHCRALCSRLLRRHVKMLATLSRAPTSGCQRDM